MWERLLDQMLGAIFTEGALEVTSPDGTTRSYGDGAGPAVRVRLLDAALARRFVLSPEMALGEGYTDGTLTIDDDDLSGLLGLAIRNRARGRGIWWREIGDRLDHAQRWWEQHAPAWRAKRNVAHHYDLSARLYDLFLDADRQYSCAYFPTGTETLEQAQAAKKRHVADKLLIEPGMHVLDIGCGWGGMALTLARDYRARVTGITLSEEQHRYAQDRVRRAGLEGRIEIRLQDYRDVRGPFDRIVSVGMFEHVGVPQYRTYFRQVHDLLAPDGVALVHTIGRSAPPRVTSPWIRKYIFPGGYVPSLSEVAAAVEREQLWLTDVEIWRLHYAETLRHWRKRFEAHQAQAAQLYDERFCRMWRYYLMASEMTFRVGWQGVFQVQLARRIDTVPTARNYLYEGRKPLEPPMAAE